MSSSDSWVAIDSKDGCSELYLQNDQYRVVAHGVGRLDTHVPPGLYKLRQRVGDIESSQVVEVAANQALHLTLQGLAFASPIPLQGTTSSHEFQQAALQETRLTAAGAGSSQLWLMLRDSRWEYGRPSPDQLMQFDRDIALLRIEALDGSNSRPLAAIAERRTDAGFVRLCVDLAPGPYVLTQEIDGQTQRCMPLMILSNWALHVFMLVAPASKATSSASSMPLNLDHSSIVYASPGTQLQPTDPGLLLLETARKAFARRRTSLAPDIVERVVDGKFINPMLGLLGAHMLLNMPAVDPGHAELVVDNTAGLLGEDFPDIIALRKRLTSLGLAKPPPRIPTLGAPPILAASWDALMEASSTFPGPDLSRLFWFPVTIESTSTWFIWNEAKGVRATGELAEADDTAEGTVFRGRGAGARRPEPSLEHIIEELLSSDRLQPWVRALKKSERETGAPPANLGQLDRTLLATISSAQASLIPEVIEPAAVANTIVANLAVPARSVRSSARKLMTQLEKWSAAKTS